MGQPDAAASSTGSPQGRKPPRIDRKSLILDALDRHPELAEKVFAELELPCADCPAAEVETLEFGFCLMEQPEEKLQTLIERLNALPAPPPGADDDEDDEGPVGPITALIGWLSGRRKAGSSSEGDDPPKR